MKLESIVRNLFLGGTLAVGLAVSLITVDSHAQTIKPCTGSCVENGVTGQTTFSLKVDKVLTITSDPTAGTITATPGSVATGTLAVTVQTNSPYTIQLSAAQPNLVNTADSSKVIKASSSVSGSDNTWGIKKMTSANAPTGNYVALTTSGVTFLDSATAAPSGVTSNFAIGVGTTATLADGTYRTPVTVTATVK